MIVVIIVCFFFGKEKFTQNTAKIAPIQANTIPEPAKTGYFLQNSTRGALRMNLASPENVTNILSTLRSQEEYYGIVTADYYTGDCTGVWKTQTNGESWSFYNYKSYNILFGIGSIPMPDKTINIVLPSDMTNTYWTLYPNHTVGIPTLQRKLNTCCGGNIRFQRWDETAQSWI